MNSKIKEVVSIKPWGEGANKTFYHNLVMENGDKINIDGDGGSISVEISEAEMDARRKAWTPYDHGYHYGALYRYSRTVGPANLGAITHPGRSRDIKE